jgi:hypothetical protein
MKSTEGLRRLLPEPTPSPRPGISRKGATPSGHTHLNLPSQTCPSKPDISTWHRLGHLYLAWTAAQNPLVRPRCFSVPQLVPRQRSWPVLPSSFAPACVLASSLESGCRRSGRYPGLPLENGSLRSCERQAARPPDCREIQPGDKIEGNGHLDLLCALGVAGGGG